MIRSFTLPGMSWASAHMERQHSSTHTYTQKSPELMFDLPVGCERVTEWRPNQQGKKAANCCVPFPKHMSGILHIVSISAWMVWDLPKWHQIKSITSISHTTWEWNIWIGGKEVHFQISPLSQQRALPAACRRHVREQCVCVCSSKQGYNTCLCVFCSFHTYMNQMCSG